jgi:glutamate-1-semialdehyde 2,1-aminomutase
MFRIHLSKNPPSSYREAWQDKELAAISVKLLDYLLDTEKLILVNTCSCMLSTVTAGKEIDRLSDGFLRGLRYIKADLESYYKNK